MRRLPVLLVALALTLAACDQSASNPDDLLADARIARQAGDIDRAVELYEAAFRDDPTDPVLRIELAAALFEQADLGIANLDEITRTFSREVSGGGLVETSGSIFASQKAGACSYADDPGAETFDPREFDGYTEYLERAPVATRVLELLDPVIDDVVRPDDFLCSGITDSGELDYDQDSALSALRATIRASDSDLTASQIDDYVASALAINAVALVLETYGFLTEELNAETDWYRLSDGTLGICPRALGDAELRDLSEDAIADFGEALVSIDLRTEVLGAGDVSTELVGLVLDVYQEFRADLAPYCAD